MKKVIIIVFGGILIFFLVLGAYWLGTKRQATPGPLPTPTPSLTPIPFTTSTPTPTVAISPTSVSKNGTIEGSLSFPSEGIPENLKVCAENQETKEVYCTDQHVKDPKYTYDLGFVLDVPAGTYLVYATLPGDDYKAYYSEFVTCGLSVDCPSHEPILVKIKAGETVSNVDPQDWYKQPG